MADPLAGTRLVLPAPDVMLRAIAFPRARPQDAYDPDEDVVDGIRARIVEEAIQTMAEELATLTTPGDGRDDRLERISSESCLREDVHAWASENMADYVFPVAIAAIARNFADQAPSFYEYVDTPRGPAVMRKLIERANGLEIQAVREWALLIDRIERRVVRYAALKEAFNALGRDGRWGEQGTKLIRIICSTYDELVDLDQKAAPLDASVWDRAEGDKEREVIASLRSTVGRSLTLEQTTRRAAQIERHRNGAVLDLLPLEHCAEPGCQKSRVFFSEDGTGYCKRHGNARGLRPHGKV